MLYQSIMGYSGAQWVHDNQKLMLPDVERLHTLQARTLLLSGVRDLEDFRLIADLIEASASDVTRIEWPDCGHLLPLENPAACAREIRSFHSLFLTESVKKHGARVGQTGCGSRSGGTFTFDTPL